MAPSGERPWAASYAPGVPLDIEVPDESLVDLLDSAVERFGALVALDFFGATTTYTELGDQVAKAAEGLRRLGVQPGDRVALRSFRTARSTWWPSTRFYGSAPSWSNTTLCTPRRRWPFSWVTTVPG